MLPSHLNVLDGTIYHGPSERPTRIDWPTCHALDESFAYAETQTSDEIRTGDVLVIETGYGRVVGIMIEAWPIAIHGTDEAIDSIGFHTLAEDARIDSIGAESWGRLMPMTICPVDAPKYVVIDFSAPRAGYDLTASFALADASK